MSKEPLFKVVFMNQGQVYEIYARQIDQGAMFGFIAVEELVFGERTTVVVDPTEEVLKVRSRLGEGAGATERDALVMAHTDKQPFAPLHPVSHFRGDVIEKTQSAVVPSGVVEHRGTLDVDLESRRNRHGLG